MGHFLDLRKTVKDEENNLISGELVLKTKLICSFDFSKETERIIYPSKKVFSEEQLILFSSQQEMLIGNTVECLILYIWKIKNWKKSIPKHIRHNYKRFFFGKCLKENEEVNFIFGSRNDENDETINAFLKERIDEFNLTNIKYFEVSSPEELDKYTTFYL